MQVYSISPKHLDGRASGRVQRSHAPLRSGHGCFPFPSLVEDHGFLCRRQQELR